ncbi:protocatechuate 3,4-dioxygenase subunit alpha [Streptomyces sp. H27-D2]|uniref:protocatechuate 3,4-dioxygenase subunit alpha n=1 Tax=Streptomyces sp. H27-D2 TaxID=3046304 RepID=UPI003FA6B8FA
MGPFYGYALPFTGGGDVAPTGHPDTVTVHGHVYDGAGAVVPDAIVEFWQADPAGSLSGAPGSMRRDRTTGEAIGRNGVDFTGFGRIATDQAGHFTLHTLPPGPATPSAAPYLAVCVFARGLLHHLHTRAYFPEHTAAHAADPLLTSLDDARRATLIATSEADAWAGDGAGGEARAAAEAPAGARAGRRRYRFDIHLQGDQETVFLEFR